MCMHSYGAPGARNRTATLPFPVPPQAHEVVYAQHVVIMSALTALGQPMELVVIRYIIMVTQSLTYCFAGTQETGG